VVVKDAIERANYTVKELAGLLDMGERQVRMALRTGQIPSIRFRRKFLIPKAAIAKWLESAGRMA